MLFDLRGIYNTTAMRFQVCVSVYLVSSSVGTTFALGSIAGYAFFFTLCFCLSPFYSDLRMCFLAKYNEHFFILLMFSGIYRVCVWVFVKYNL